MNRAWHRYPDDPPRKSGIYLTIVSDPGDGVVTCYPCTCDYFLKDEVVDYKMPAGCKNAEERLYRILMDESIKIKADEDGFYERSDGNVWKVIPEMWRELPDPPENMVYYGLSEDK